jgi:hypothetical protein
VIVGTRLSATARERAETRKTERALLLEVNSVRSRATASPNHGEVLDALVGVAHDYERAVSANPKWRRRLSAARDSIASVVTTWDVFDLYNGGSEMPSGWMGHGGEDGMSEILHRVAKTHTDSVARQPGDDSVRVRRLFCFVMDEGLGDARGCYGWYGLSLSSYYGSVPESVKRLKWGADEHISKLNALIAIYKSLYGQDELDYFLVEHKLPKGTSRLPTLY